jgi:hypothetical protein
LGIRDSCPMLPANSKRSGSLSVGRDFFVAP